MDALFDEMRVAGPTMMVSAPRLYDTMYSEWQREMAEAEATGGEAFNAPMTRRALLAKYGAMLGSRMQCVCTGGAATGPATMAFLREVFPDIIVADGYGASECGGMPPPFVGGLLVV